MTHSMRADYLVKVGGGRADSIPVSKVPGLRVYRPPRLLILTESLCYYFCLVTPPGVQVSAGYCVWSLNKQNR